MLKPVGRCVAKLFFESELHEKTKGDKDKVIHHAEQAVYYVLSRYRNRIRAELEPNAGVLGVPVEDFIDGNNDIVLFTGVTWSEPHGRMMVEGIAEGAAMHFSGHPGQLSETAEVVCVTTDAFVVASAAGRGILIRTGLRPGSLEVERNPEQVRAFLLERGYEG